jgi:HJR/Mrr/RecB family endonuclease
LLGDCQEFTTNEFILFGIDGLLPKHMSRLINNLKFLEQWFSSAKYHHIYNFFGFLDERDRKIEIGKNIENQKIAILERQKLIEDQLKNVVHFAKIHRVLLGQKRNLTIHLNEYQIETDSKKWHFEVEYFITNVARVNIDEYNKLVLFNAVDNIAKNNKSNLSNFQKVNSHAVGYEFESECAEILNHSGWSVTRTKASGDQGVDLVANFESISVAIQCKKYSTPVGNKAVQEIYAGGSFVQCDFYVVVSNNSFTSSAKQLAQKLGVHLIHQNDLENLLDLLNSSSN